MAHELTHRVAYFDAKGAPMSIVSYSGTLKAVEEAAVKHAPKTSARIHITNDVEGTSKKKGQLVAQMSRGRDGHFHKRYNPEPIRAYDKQRHGIQGNPSKPRARISKTALAGLTQVNDSMRAATKRLGR